MTFKCFGWANQCHVGLDTFFSEKDGMCVDEPDKEIYSEDYPFKLWFVCINGHSDAHSHRKFQIYVLDHLVYEVGVRTLADYDEVYIWIEEKGYEVDTVFKLIDSDTDEVLCSRRVYYTEEPEEPFTEPVPEWEEVDYGKIAGIVSGQVSGGVINVKAAIDSSVSDVKEAIEGVNTGVDRRVGEIEGSITTAQTTLNEGITGISSYLTGMTESIKDDMWGLSETVKKIKPPTLDSIKDMMIDLCIDLANALWDRVLDKIEERYKVAEEESD